MSKADDFDLPLGVIESNREHIERLARSELPISADAERLLALADDEDEDQL
jgi:hypothetical protein